MSRPELSRATLKHIADALLLLDFPDRKRQEIVSAIRTIARVIGRDPENILADLRTLNAEIATARPVSVGVTEGRWRNCLSLLRAALAATSKHFRRGRSMTSMSGEWAALFNQIRTRKDRYCLSRLLRWLTENEIAPDGVRLSDLERHGGEVTHQTLLVDADAKWDAALRAWNRCVRNVSGWPQVQIPRLSKSKNYSLPWKAFPSSLKVDVEAWCARASGQDWLSPNGIDRPLAKATIRGRRHLLQAHASALVHRGVDPASLVSIASCLNVENFTEGLRFFLERLGEDSPTVHQKAFELRAIAKNRCDADDAALSRMSEIVRRLDPGACGMTDKNRERLLPLQSADVRRQLFALPSEIRSDIVRGRINDYRARVLAQVAVAIELLIVAPLRIKNLATIEVGRHLVCFGDRTRLIIPASEVKNLVPLEFELPPESAELINWCLNRRSDADRQISFLFPGAGSSPKSVNTLAIQIKGTIRARTGLELNPHLFRHFAALLFLEANPGQYEVVRQVLGHKRLETTMRAYVGLETLSATRHFDKTISGLRRGPQK